MNFYNSIHIDLVTVNGGMQNARCLYLFERWT